MKFLEFQLKDIVPIIIALVTLIMTIKIPIWIMQFQRYTNLASTYMSFDFAHAFQSVIEFFYKDCDCDVERIPEEYAKRYHSDFQKLKDKKIEREDVLHYQRRLLNDYFYELEVCRTSSRRLGKMIKKDWTTSEANVTKILICMNKVVSEHYMMDISAVKYQHIPKVKGISEYLSRFYKALKDGKPWMQVR